MSVPNEALQGVSRETVLDLERFVELFRAFAAHTNLVARSQLPDLWTRHVLDSAQLVRLKPRARRWLDLGSGGGFPGIVTAILLKGGEGAHVDLVESTGKKAAFLRSAIEALSLPATVWSERVEGLGGRVPQPEAVSARALAPLERLLDWASPWLLRGATGLFHKGRNHAQELLESRVHWDFTVLKHESLTDSQAAILEIEGLRRR
jgi:16S rRNA (guanine527-N7)-methyltransferase